MISQEARKIKHSFYSDRPEVCLDPWIEQQGGRITCRIPQLPEEHKGGGIRGKIFGRSDASRRRLMDTFASIDWTYYESALFLGLSFPDPMPAMEKRKAMLKALRSWIERRFPGVGMNWVIEYGRKTGRFHFHLLVLQTARIPIKELEAEWCKLGGGSPDPKGNSVDIEEVPGQRVSRYLSKYCSKAAGQRISKNSDKSTDVGAFGAGSPGRGATNAPAPLGLSTAHISTETETEHISHEWTGQTWGWWNLKNIRFADLCVRKLDNIPEPKKYAAKIRRTAARWLTANRRKAEERLCKTALVDRDTCDYFARTYGGRPSQYRFLTHRSTSTVEECKEEARAVLRQSKCYTRNQIKVALQMLRARPFKSLPNHLRRSQMTGFTLYVPNGFSLECLFELFDEHVDSDGVVQDESGYSAWARIHLRR